MPLKIGEVASQTGVSVEAVRYYERLGLLPEAPRSRSGYRQFDAQAVRWLGFIQRAQELGFSLWEIREMLALWQAPEGSAAQVRDMARTKISEVEAKIRDLVEIRDALEAVTSSCTGAGPAADCPILHVLAEPAD